MPFTYSASLATTRDRVRFEVGDTTTPNHLFDDSEITYKLTENGDNILTTAAQLCRQLAVRFARQADFAIDEQSVKLSQKSKAYERMADRLLAQSQAGMLASTAVTKIDGYQPENDPVDSNDRSRQNRTGDFDVGRFS